MDIDLIDNKLYKATYITKDRKEQEKLWKEIRNNKEILKEAIKVTRNKMKQRDILKGMTIANNMLFDYKNVDKQIYNKLIDTIYKNKDIARLVMDGYSNGGYSFLLISLFNYDLKLTQSQKDFAVEEAMNKIGTKKYCKEQEIYSKSLEEKNITDDTTSFIDIDGSVNPVGLKTKCEYINYVFNTLSDTQAHGRGDFDIRYHILRNPNWTVEEKQKLIFDFWSDSKDYDDRLEQWEYGVINDEVNDDVALLLIENLYYYKYSNLLEFYKDVEITNRIWEEINFLKLMHKLRPQQWELEFINQKIKK